MHTAVCVATAEVEMSTGKKPASKAGKELRDPKSTDDEKAVAASDLSQAKSGKGKKPDKKPR
jgi:hypothetical protein